MVTGSRLAPTHLKHPVLAAAYTDLAVASPALSVSMDHQPLHIIEHPIKLYTVLIAACYTAGSITCIIICYNDCCPHWERRTLMPNNTATPYSKPHVATANDHLTRKSHMHYTVISGHPRLHNSVNHNIAVGHPACTPHNSSSLSHSHACHAAGHTTQ